MCGIAGLVWTNSNTKSVAAGELVVSEMISQMRHRGPDGLGLVSAEDYVLGHTRLAIIDPESGAQPLGDPEETVHLSFNGEIYDYQEKIREQKRRGWRFQSESDTETLLAGYILDGADFDLSLNGMYAFAIADTRPSNECLLLAVDPVGIKPLYLAEVAGAYFSARNCVRWYPG